MSLRRSSGLVVPLLLFVLFAIMFVSVEQTQFCHTNPLPSSFQQTLVEDDPLKYYVPLDFFHGVVVSILVHLLFVVHL
jgi:hypothetical protein